MVNGYQEEMFICYFTVAKIARYMAICEKDPTQKKFIYGWIRRTLGGMQ